MQKFVFGCLLFASGILGVIALMSATIICPIIPWDYCGIEGWFAVIMGMKLLIPFIVFLAIAIIGAVICIKEIYSKK